MKKVDTKAPAHPVATRKSPQITVRLNSPELERWLDRRVAEMQANEPARRITISEVVRAFLYDAMQAEAAEKTALPGKE